MRELLYVAEPECIKASGMVRSYGGATSGIPVDTVRAVAEGMTLEHFLMLLDQAAVGLSWESLTGVVEGVAGELSWDRPFRQGAATFGAVAPTGTPGLLFE